MEGRAGFAVVDITPPVGVELCGYHRASPSEGILDRLYATAVAFETAEARAVFISVDNVGMAVADANSVRDRIAEALGMRRSDIMLRFTHTHSGPWIGGEEDPHRMNLHALGAHLVHAAREAWDALRPCRVGWGVAHAQIGENRRERGSDGKVRMGRHPEGPTDDRIGVLKVADTASGELMGLLVVCTAHANVLKGDSTVISGDYPGRTQEMLHRALGCPVAMLNGACGNVNARWRGTVEDLERMAQAVSGAALGALPLIDPTPLRELSIDAWTLEMGLMPLPQPEEAKALAEVVAREWEVDTSPWLDVVQRMYGDGRRDLTIDLEIQALRLQGGAVAGIPMEPFVESALEVRRRLGNEAAFFGGYTNGLIGYLPTEEEFPLGGYEVAWMPVVYGIACGGYLMPARPETLGRVVDEVVRLYDAQA